MAERKRAAVSSDSSSSGTSDSESSEDEIGPKIPEAQEQDTNVSEDKSLHDVDEKSLKNVKKRKKLEFEKVFLEDLPNSERYEKSFMHRDVVTHTLSTAGGFIVTASADGHIKFWKKDADGLEFVKHFRAHVGNIQDLSVNSTGTLLISISNDKNGKVFDIQNFDMINILKFPEKDDNDENLVPQNCEWIYQPGDIIPAVAISFVDSKMIHIYDGKAADSTPIKILNKLHLKSIVAMSYNVNFGVVVSADKSGMLEYWMGPKQDYKIPDKKVVMFDSKLDTDLFELAKKKTYALSLNISPDGKFIAAFGADRKIRIFRFLSGKLYCVIDESLSHHMKLQGEKRLFPAMDFNRKMAFEKELEKMDNILKLNNIVFDKTSNFILYPSVNGIKLVNIYTNKIITVIGKGENLRFLNIALSQASDEVTGAAGEKDQTLAPQSVEMHVSENPGLVNKAKPAPVLFCTAHKKNRFYLFTRKAPKDHDSERDVFNEKPTQEERNIAITEDVSMARRYESATMHTSVGDIHVKLFPRECPKTVENFCVHAKNNYYNGHIFHRIIKQFMCQTGDPTGIGTGGESIWGGEFEDEFNHKLRHDRPYTLSMANAGPNTNGSQFFFTVVPTPWLDNKHTVFGRIIRGMDIALNISNAKTHPKSDKPYDDISILSITLKEPVKSNLV
jgi:peptidylprolyl isomerase domain and WD repeat-containing protein 1